MVLLERTLMMISEMKVRLKYLNMPVYDLISFISENKTIGKIDFLCRCSMLVSEGEDFPVAWKEALSCTSQYRREEKDDLLQLGLNLGTSNTENQIELLSVHKQNFEIFLKNARAKEQKYGKMSITLSTLFGCMLFITMI